MSANNDSVSQAVQFLSALFVPSDVVLYRPIETWDEGRKHSRVVYNAVMYRAAEHVEMETTVSQLLKFSEDERANVFFGVCPRVGGNQRYDLAWQIRTVRALWADLDHCTAAEADKRCRDAGLAKPSIAVSSGNGVHLYWLLKEPYLITDAGEPPPVLTEWVSGQKKPRRYIVDEQGDQIDVSKKNLLPALSAQAVHIQDVLSGIAAKIGGDHTTDLSRLLRVPGTLNRKNQRNGAEPVPCSLIAIDAACRYPIEVFEPLRECSPDAKQRAKIAQMPLPRPKSKLSNSNLHKLDDWIARVTIAEKGTRSEADFGLCCFAIKHGVAKEVLWSRVQHLGKFAEAGEPYFERTWSRAEAKVRSDKYDSLTQAGSAPTKTALAVANSRLPVIEVDPSKTPLQSTLSEVTQTLLDSGECFQRASQCVVVAGNDLRPLITNVELGGYLSQKTEFVYVNGRGLPEYKPLSSVHGNTWLNNPSEVNRLPKLKLFSRNPVYAPDWQLVSPGYNASSGIYYAGNEITPRDGTAHLDALLKDFCFRKPGDRTNYLGMLVTCVLVSHFIGSKPAVLLNGNQPGLGKSILAQIIAIIRDGKMVQTATYNPDDQEFEKRLGTLVRDGFTTLIIDNAKARKNKTDGIDSPCLERSITDPELSFRLLGKNASIRAENSHIFCITANAPDVSRDLVTRSVIVNLEHEGDPTKRSFSLADPEGYAEDHREAILGELLGMIERWKAAGRPLADTHTRFDKRNWGRIVGGILAVNGLQGFLSNAEEAATEFDHTRRDFAELVALLAEKPGEIFRPGELTVLAMKHGLLQEALGAGSERSQSTKMGHIASRYVAERFSLDDQGLAVFCKHEGRKGPAYYAEIIQNDESARPLDAMPDVDARRSGTLNSLHDKPLPDLPDVARPFSNVIHACSDDAHVHTHVSGKSYMEKGPAGLACLAECDHFDPTAWLVRDGSAWCPGCEKFMGRAKP